MKKLFSTIATLQYAVCMIAQPTQEWAQIFSPPTSATTKAIALDNAGNIYCAGRYHVGPTSSLLLLKYDPAGNLIWSQTNSGGTIAYSVLVDGNGDIIVVGSIGPSGSVIVKYDASGSVLWTQTTTLNSSNSTRSITIDEINNIYFYGYSPSSSPSYHQTIKFNSSGVQQWASTYNEIPNQSYTSNNRATSIIYRNGFVYVTGSTVVQIPAAQRNVILSMKYNASNGAQVWAVTYIHADKNHQHGVDLAADGSGNLYVTGRVAIKAGSNTNPNWVTLKYNSSGIQQWVKFYDGSATDYQNIDKGIYQGFEYPTVMTMDPGGNVIVTGTSYETNGSFTNQNITTVKYSATGTQLWMKTYESPAHGDDYGKAITTDASANIYVTGSAGIPANSSAANATTIKYNSLGVQQWTATYDAGVSVNDYTTSIGVDGTDNAYVAGGTGFSSLLIKYSQGSPAVFTKMADTEIKDAGINVLKLYPNPATNQITLYNGNDKMLGSVSVYDASGKMVYQKLAGSSQIVIDVQKFVSGIYYLRLDQSATAIKFVKQ